MSIRASMRSPKALAGALMALAGVPLAIAVSNFGGDAEGALHAAIGAGFLFFALAAFDFQTPRWLTLVSCVAIGALALIFLLQAASHAAPSLRRIAYDALGQSIEKSLGWIFLLWCLAILVFDSSGWRRVIGALVLAAVLCVEGYSVMLSLSGAGPASDALKLLYLPLFVWLALESLEQR